MKLDELLKEPNKDLALNKAVAAILVLEKDLNQLKLAGDKLIFLHLCNSEHTKNEKPSKAEWNSAFKNLADAIEALKKPEKHRLE